MHLPLGASFVGVPAPSVARLGTGQAAGRSTFGANRAAVRGQACVDMDMDGRAAGPRPNEQDTNVEFKALHAFVSGGLQASATRSVVLSAAFGSRRNELGLYFWLIVPLLRGNKTPDASASSDLLIRVMDSRAPCRE